MEEKNESSVKKKKKITCEVCEKSFSSTTNLKVHLRTHDKVRPYFCCYCKWSFRQHSHLQRHLEKVHRNGVTVKTSRYKFECKECHKCYSEFQKLISHDLLVHQKSQFLTCQLCDVRHRDLDGVMQHYKLMHGDVLCLKNDQLYVCLNDACQSTFDSLAQLKEHQLNHDDEDNGMGAAQASSEQVDKSSFDDEGFEENPGKRTYKGSEKKLKEQEKLPCKICSTRFLSVDNLTLHIVKCHMSPDATKCIKCGKSYKKLTSARQHIRYLRCPVFRRELESEGVVVSEVVPSLSKKTCSICSVSFNSIYLKDIHMRKHNGLKPFYCQQCGKSFNQAGNLKTHVQTMHEGQHKTYSEQNVTKKQHHCDVCQKYFTSAVDLQVHRRVHNEIKPHTCHYCGRGFAQKGNLNAHLMRRVDGECAKRAKPTAASATFLINQKVDHEMPIHTSPDYFLTSFKVTDLVPPKPVDIVPSLVSTYIVTRALPDVDFNIEESKLDQYMEDLSETNSSTRAAASSSGVAGLIIAVNQLISSCATRETCTITKNESIGDQEHSNCHEVNVITSGTDEPVTDEAALFSMINDVTAPINDSTTMSEDNTSTNDDRKSEETNVITNSNVIVGSSIPALGERDGSRYNCRDGVGTSSSSNSHQLQSDNVSNNMMMNQGMNFLNNSYLCNAYDIFEGDSINCAKYTEHKDSSLNSQEVNVISCSPFVETENMNQLCKETNVIIAVTTETGGHMFDVPVTTNVEKVTCKLMTENENVLYPKGVNMAEFNTESFNTTATSNSSEGAKSVVSTLHSQPCRETNVIKIGQKTRAIVSPNRQRNSNGSSRGEHSSETNAGEDNEISNVGMEDCIIDNIYDFDTTPVKNSSLCKETNVIKGLLSSFELPTTYIQVENNFDREVVPIENNSYSGPCSYPCQEINVITGGSVQAESPTVASPLSQETYVITSLGVPLDLGSGSVLNDGHKETNVIKNANLNNVCQATNVIMGVNDPLRAGTSRTRKDNIIHVKSLDIMRYGSKSCKQTNVIRQNTASEKNSSTEISDMSYLSESPYVGQVTNVITSVSFSVEDTTSYLRDSNPSDNNSKGGKARVFSNMSSNFVNGLSSPFDSADPFEASPSFESIEEELAPYEIEETKGLESINFNTFYQGLFTSVPTSTTKAQVIVNNSIFNENFLNYIEQPDPMQMHNVGPTDCALLSDDENEFSDLNWYHNSQPQAQASNLDNVSLGSVATVIKNVSGGEVKDIEGCESATMRISSSDKVFSTCNQLENQNET